MSYREASYKYVLCSKCSTTEVKVSVDAVGGICWICCQKSVEPPKLLVQQKKKKNTVRKQRGWQFMAVYVDSEGNVYHKGIEQPKLKGTLPPTPRKETKKKTFREKIEQENKEREKLLRQYNRKKKGK